jgi:hypothetical protein
MMLHTVFVRMNDRSPEHARTLRDELIALEEKTPGVVLWHVGVNDLAPDAEYDVALISGFATEEDLEVYRTHPAHLEMLGRVRPLIERSTIVDYASPS